MQEDEKDSSVHYVKVKTKPQLDTFHILQVIKSFQICQCEHWQRCKWQEFFIYCCWVCKPLGLAFKVKNICILLLGPFAELRSKLWQTIIFPWWPYVPSRFTLALAVFLWRAWVGGLKQQIVHLLQQSRTFRELLSFPDLSLRFVRN